MHAAPRSPWTVARTVIAASGLGFVTLALGGACLDYAGENFGACATDSSGVTSTGAGSGTDDGTTLKAGSGVGNGAPDPAAGMDCGTPGTSVPDAGGSGSAAP